jgi:hypothetical protein
MRAKAGFYCFTGMEGDFSDFILNDPNGGFTHLLINQGPAYAAPPTYHLEVKPTSESCEKPFSMSYI